MPRELSVMGACPETYGTGLQYECRPRSAADAVRALAAPPRRPSGGGYLVALFLVSLGLIAHLAITSEARQAPEMTPFRRLGWVLIGLGMLGQAVLVVLALRRRAAQRKRAGVVPLRSEGPADGAR